ncbi:MAG: hypothetical protein JHC95_02865 [Solirubrobacteraceae bacterium]|nr:hypothetical protein [Solirubrobacteraceae bacterium]
MAEEGTGVGGRLQAAKLFARDLFKTYIAAWLWVRPRDRWMFWSLPVPDRDDGPTVDILRIGSCEDRAMPHNHQANGPLGFPRFMLGELARNGIRAGYQNMWVWMFEELPVTERDLLKRRRKNRPAPDLVFVQVGPIYAGRHYLGGHRRVIGMRENAGKRIGPLIYPIWRVISKLLRWGGFKTIDYPGPDALDAFLDITLKTWPDVLIALYEPTSPVLEGGLFRHKIDDLTAELHAAAERAGDRVKVLPRPELGLDMRFRISNGYNVNEAGSRVVGRHFADWIMAQPGLVKVPQAADASGEPDPAVRDAV